MVDRGLETEITGTKELGGDNLKIMENHETNSSFIITNSSQSRTCFRVMENVFD